MASTPYGAMKRKAERERVAALFEAMAARAGATCRRSTSSLFPRAITLHINMNGAAVFLHLDGDSRVGAFLAHWHFDDHRGRLFRDGFDGHGYRAHHKATSMAGTAEDMCTRLEAMLGWVADDSAFVTEAAP